MHVNSETHSFTLYAVRDTYDKLPSSSSPSPWISMFSVNEFQCLIDQILNWFYLLWILTPKNLFYFLNFTKPWQNYYKKRWGYMLQINYIHSDVKWFEDIMIIFNDIMIILFSSPFYLNKVDNNFVRNTCTWIWNKRRN